MLQLIPAGSACGANTVTARLTASAAKRQSCRLLLLVLEARALARALPAAVAAAQRGDEVHLALPAQAAEQLPQQLEGVRLHWLPRRGRLATLFGLYRRLAPDVAHHIGSRAVWAGGLVTATVAAPAVINEFAAPLHQAGAASMKARALRHCWRWAYALPLRQRHAFVVATHRKDARWLVDAGLVSREQVRVGHGCGLDLTRFPSHPEPAAPPLVVLPAPMRWSQGVWEFVSLAAQVRLTGSNVRFALVGTERVRGAQDAISEAQLQRLHDSGLVEWWGVREDRAAVYAEAHLVCLPATTAEAAAVLLEAAASGRAAVAGDSPCAREIVEQDGTGLLVPYGKALALHAAVTRLLAEPQIRRRMGLLARARAHKEFGVERVLADTLALYQELLSPAPSEYGASARSSNISRPLAH